MLTPEAAWQIIDSELSPLSPESSNLRDSTGRVLAEAVPATVDMPPADVSAMDGYILGAGSRKTGDAWPVVATVAAGLPPDFDLEVDQAAKIMTGAVVPRGGDRVVPIELTDGGSEQVRIHQDTAGGAHIRRQGEVVKTGEPLLAAGDLLTPAAVSLLASHGYTSVAVPRRPRVSVLTTGDELVPVEVEPGPGQLRDSNSPFLASAGRGLGYDFKVLGIASDRRQDLETKIRQGLESDVLLLSGGVSKGEFDLVEDVLEDLGCRQLFDAVAIQPGKPLVVSKHERGWVFGLPGNPASVMVTFWLFVRPLLNRLQGHNDAFWRGALTAELTGDLTGAKGRDRFLTAEIDVKGGRLTALPQPPKGSHDVACYARGTALVRVRARQPPAKAGEACEILRIS